MNNDWPSPETTNNIAFELVNRAINDSENLEIYVEEIGGATVLDFAVGRVGSPSSGMLLSQICMSGLAAVEYVSHDPMWSQIQVHTNKPLRCCIGSQYAGWPMSDGDFFAMCSGPMRMLCNKEQILADYDLGGTGEKAVGVLESNTLPTEAVIVKIAASCGVDPKDICLCVARTASHPGSIQVVARSLETALHKLYELDFDLRSIIEGTGHAPIPPIADDDLTALGWTNDCVLYGGKVELTVDTEDEMIESIIDRIPSCSSHEFGTPFLDIFNHYERDFYKIDKMLFSPAQITITNQRTNKVFKSGEVRNDILVSSFKG
ncbi:MAG: methenyltetrahydromethanopterin cyclohydrolase [Mariniblastus sp.]